jgi:hypothetical protein
MELSFYNVIMRQQFKKYQLWEGMCCVSGPTNKIEDYFELKFQCKIQKDVLHSFQVISDSANVKRAKEIINDEEFIKLFAPAFKKETKQKRKRFRNEVSVKHYLG